VATLAALNNVASWQAALQDNPPRMTVGQLAELVLSLCRQYAGDLAHPLSLCWPELETASGAASGTGLGEDFAASGASEMDSCPPSAGG
jgi:hypothetical protein